MKVARHSRIAVETCPRCSGHALVSNGAFWSCDACCYAVTSTALTADRMAAEAAVREALRKAHPRFDQRAGTTKPELETVSTIGRR